MNRLTYNIATGRNPEFADAPSYESVTGWTTGTAGLAVHKWDGSGLGWTVDHLATGRPIVRPFAKRSQALELAEAVSGFDWTQGPAELIAMGAAQAALDAAHRITAGVPA